MNEDLLQLKREVEELKNWKRSLEASHSIPLSIDQAFRARFVDLGALSTSTKATNSEDEVIDESGLAIHSVLQRPDEYLKGVVNGAIKYIPAYQTL